MILNKKSLKNLEGVIQSVKALWVEALVLVVLHQTEKVLMCQADKINQLDIQTYRVQQVQQSLDLKELITLFSNLYLLLIVILLVLMEVLETTFHTDHSPQLELLFLQIKI